MDHNFSFFPDVLGGQPVHACVLSSTPLPLLQVSSRCLQVLPMLLEWQAAEQECR